MRVEWYSITHGVLGLSKVCWLTMGVDLIAANTLLVNPVAGLMHLDKCCNFPRRLWSCFLEAFDFSFQVEHSHTTSATVSIRKPSQAKEIVDGTHLVWARDKPN